MVCSRSWSVRIYSQTISVMIIRLTVILSLQSIFNCLAVLPPQFHIQSTIGNSGHGFAAQLHMTHLQPELAVSSVDGELLLLDLTNTVKIMPPWPIYLHKEHFLARPVMYDVNEDGQEDVIFLSHSGTFYVYTTDGKLLRQRTIHSLDAPRLSTRQFFESSGHGFPTSPEVWCANGKVCDFLWREVGAINSSLQLRPEVFSSGVLCDLDGDGKISELLVPVNFVAYRVQSSDNGQQVQVPHAMLASVLLLDLVSFQLLGTLHLHFAKEKEPMPYMLADLTSHSVLDPSPATVVLVPLASGHVFPIRWSVPTKSLFVMHGFPAHAAAPFQHPAVLAKQLLIAGDREGSLYAWHLNKGTLAWKFSSERKEELTPLTAFTPSQSLIFATTSGTVHSIFMVNGTELPGFPVRFPREEFSSSGMRYHWMGEEYIAFLSSSGSLHSIHLDRTARVAPRTSQASLGPVRSRSTPLLLRFGNTARVCVLSMDGQVHLFSPPLHRTSVDHGQQMMAPREDTLYLGPHHQLGQHSSLIRATGKLLNLPFTLYTSALLDPSLHEFILHVSVHGGPGLQTLYQDKLTPSQVHLVPQERAVKGDLRIEMSSTATLRPFRGRVWVRICVSQHAVGQPQQREMMCAEDSVFLRMNWEFLHELYALLVTPFLVALGGLLLLLLHREADAAEKLLPTTLFVDRNK